ncbi:hypothetical protein FB451DRAFT_374255 [Mycena latifolia]|nr:hypothetical protein FB451DRAFT_374255 [Mycena latifolia]
MTPFPVMAFVAATLPQTASPKWTSLNRVLTQSSLRPVGACYNAEARASYLDPSPGLTGNKVRNERGPLVQHLPQRLLQTRQARCFVLTAQW